MRKNHILLFIMMKSFNQKIYSRNILFLKDAIYIVSASYEQFYKLFSSALLYIRANTGDNCPSTIRGSVVSVRDTAPDTRTSRSQPPSEATTSRMSPTANLQSITVSSWQGLNGWSVNGTLRNFIMAGDRTQNACPHCPLLKCLDCWWAEKCSREPFLSTLSPDEAEEATQASKHSWSSTSSHTTGTLPYGEMRQEPSGEVRRRCWVFSWWDIYI